MAYAWIRSRRPLLDLLGVLLTLLAWSAIHGARSEPLAIAGHAFEQPDLNEWFAPGKPVGAADRPLAATRPVGGSKLLTSAAAPGPLFAGGVAQRLAEPGSSASPPTLPAPHRILMLGDSMIEPLQQRAAAYARAAGHKFISVIWYGSRTLDWGKGSRLAETLRTYAPTYVIVVLGSNELMARDVEQRALRVQSMLKTLGSLPVVWVGPPSWREDHGYNAMLARELGAHFFRSDTLEFERKSDGIHPTDASGAWWMDRVAEWLRTRPDQTQLVLAPPKGPPRHHAPARVWAPPSR
jgi:hypothetical protein